MSELNKKLGKVLKDERDRQGINIEDLSERLKITIPNLQSIEAGSTDGLPSELYFTLFAKSYAEALGVDYTRTVEAIKSDVSEASEKKVESKKTEKKSENGSEEESESQLLKKSGIALAVIIGLFLIFLGVNKFLFSDNSTDMQNYESSSTTEKQRDVQEEQALDEAYKNYDWENKEYKEPSKLVLTLIPKEESWSTVLADGDTSIYRTLKVGRTYTAEADYRLLVSVGIPSVVTIKLNGKEVDLRDRESRRVSKVLINQMNVDTYLNPKPETAEAETVENNVSQAPDAESIDTVSVENNDLN